MGEVPPEIPPPIEGPTTPEVHPELPPTNPTGTGETQGTLTTPESPDPAQLIGQGFQGLRTRQESQPQDSSQNDGEQSQSGRTGNGPEATTDTTATSPEQQGTKPELVPLTAADQKRHPNPPSGGYTKADVDKMWAEKAAKGKLTEVEREARSVGHPPPETGFHLKRKDGVVIQARSDSDKAPDARRQFDPNKGVFMDITDAPDVTSNRTEIDRINFRRPNETPGQREAAQNIDKIFREREVSVKSRDAAVAETPEWKGYQNEVETESRRIGENAADYYAADYIAHEGRAWERVFPTSTDGKSRPNEFDLVYRDRRDNAPDRYIIIEAKGGLPYYDGLSSRNINNVRYEQGTQEYFEDTARAMSQRGYTIDGQDAGKLLLDADAAGNVEYLHLKANIVETSEKGEGRATLVNIVVSRFERPRQQQQQPASTT